MLGVLVGAKHLYQHRLLPLQLFTLLVQLGGKFLRVHGLDQEGKRGQVGLCLSDRHQLLYLVGLDVPNKVPLDVPRKLRHLLHEFVDIILSKLSLPTLIGREDVLYGLGL